MSERLQVLLQHLLPKQALTSLAGSIAGANAGSVTTRLIRWFVKRYGVDMSEADNPDIASYKNFSDFFTRIGESLRKCRASSPGRCDMLGEGFNAP